MKSKAKHNTEAYHIKIQKTINKDKILNEIRVKIYFNYKETRIIYIELFFRNHATR